MTTFAPRAGIGSHYERSLLRAAQHNDLRAHERLLELFQPLLDAAVRRSRLPRGTDPEDLAQEARIAFLRAIMRWSPERGPFAAFARTCVRNHLLNALDTAGTDKHQILSQARHIDAHDASDRHAQDPLANSHGQPFDRELVLVSRIGDPESLVIIREHLQALGLAMRSLTTWERAALRAAVNGASHDQIAHKHGVSVRAATLAVRRARNKLAARAD